jgi:2-polyprenyl-6-methoxyphenol hydroxylase-like FAD-dependent oxidoreductase
MSAQPQKVLVIGGGIGGLALGQALAGTGVDVEIFERNHRTGDWAEGHRLSINQVGSRALHHCLPEPLWIAFVTVAADPGFGLAFRTERLKELLLVEREVMTGGVTGPVGNQYAVSRTVLRHVLTAGLEGAIRFGKEFEHYRIGGDGRVTAVFSDGGTATGDVLVAADGANSRVRRQYLPKAERIETDAISIAGRLPLTDETRGWLPDFFSGGMNSILPNRGAFMFTSAFAGRQRMTGAVDGGLDLAALGLDPALLLDDLQDYLLWAYITHHKRVPVETSMSPVWPK